MTTIEYRSPPTLPCDIPKMKRFKLESLAIEQMQRIIDLENELQAVKNVCHKQALKIAIQDTIPNQPYIISRSEV